MVFGTNVGLSLKQMCGSSILICTASTPLQNRDGVTERTVNLKQKIYSRISK